MYVGKSAELLCVLMFSLALGAGMTLAMPSAKVTTFTIGSNTQDQEMQEFQLLKLLRKFLKENSVSRIEMSVNINVLVDNRGSNKCDNNSEVSLPTQSDPLALSSTETTKALEATTSPYIIDFKGEYIAINRCYSHQCYITYCLLEVPSYPRYSKYQW